MIPYAPAATYRICADGGANRLRSAFFTSVNTEAVALPHAVVGDLDSLTDKTKSFFANLGVQIVEKPSQYATDLQKAIQTLEDWEGSEVAAGQSQAELVIFGGLSGRLDQTAHTLHVLWKLCPGLAAGGGYEDPDANDTENARGGNLRKRSRTYVLGDGSLVWLLPPGHHRLVHPRPVLGKACGILPFGVEAGSGNVSGSVGARVKTKGLQWDVEPDQPQSLGGYLSTSNYLPDGDSPEVILETDKAVYWSVEIEDAGGHNSADD